MHARTTSTLGAAVLAVALAAGTAHAQQNSGFLPDYSRLTPAKDNSNAKRWVRKGFDFKPYQKIMLDPVEVWVSPTSEYKGASPDVLKRMGDHFTNAFRKALSPGYELVEQPGPDVLRIKLAITGIQLVGPSKNPTDFLPIIFVAKTVTGVNSAKRAALTGEMQVLDPENKLVVAAVSTGTGDKNVDQQKQITWADLESITNTWAQRLRKGLDDARGAGPQ